MYSSILQKCLVLSLLIILCVSTFIINCKDDDKPAQPAPNNEWKFTMVSGDYQTVRTLDTLTNRLVVKLVDGSDNPLENKQINFTVIDGNGMVMSKPSASPNEVNTITDWEGKASVNFESFAVDTSLVKATVTDKPALTVTFTIYGTD